MFWTYLTLILLSCFLPGFCQRSATWDTCKCKWAKWAEWSKCNRGCYGNRTRFRSVWKSPVPECNGYLSCDGGSGGIEIQSCNLKCTFGNWDEELEKCLCPKGKMGECCDQDVLCSVPTRFDHGKTNGSVFKVGDSVSFECNKDYKLFGKPHLKCGLSGWDDLLPRCLSRNPCGSNPCPKGRLCVEDKSGYTCKCPEGMEGPGCNIDNVAPTFTNCSADVNLTTSYRKLNYTWTVPQAFDPKGGTVAVTSNYPANHYEFPWGDFTVVYNGVKSRNSLKTKCEFSVRIRPKSCPRLSPPTNGYLVCNNWRTDYGVFCLVGCWDGFTLPPGFDGHQWVVCGSSGHWTPREIPNKCERSMSSPRKSIVLPNPKNCQEEPTLAKSRKTYLKMIKSSAFQSFCSVAGDACNERNVSVKC